MVEKVRLGDHLDFSAGTVSPVRVAGERYPVYGANGSIGYASEYNARGPLIVIGRVGSYCGSLRYCDRDVWVTDNALICRANNPEETRYWYYALQNCGLNRLRAGSGQPLLNQSTLRDVSVWDVAPDRYETGEILGALDDKIAANDRVIEAAEALMVAIAGRVSDWTALSSLASRSTTSLEPEGFDGVVAHYSFTAFDSGVQPRIVDRSTIKSSKFVLSDPCVLFSKLNPRIPRIWNVLRLPSKMALASTEFVVLRPIGIDTSALWSALRQPGVLAILQQRVAGMTGSRQRIQPGELLGVAVPDVRRLGVGPAATLARVAGVCHRRRAESAELSAVRDALLPLLMTGKVRARSATAMVGSDGVDRLPCYRYPSTMSLNIKSERTVALVRELAARTGANQTAAIEDAVARRLSELDREESVGSESKRAAAEKTLQELDKLLTDDDKRAIRQAEVDLYDDRGLPR